MKILVTGGAGFIGSNFVRRGLERWPEAGITVLDKLTYAGNRQNLAPIQDNPRYAFIQGDICNAADVAAAIADCTHVVNFAAETHVDRSILEPDAFLHTDIEGTRVLLEAVRAHNVERFLQVSTDEVYGEIPAPERVAEDAPLRPRSPYSASKAGGDLMVGAYISTFGVPALITRGSNTYGPYQFPEKLIPLFVTNALDGLPLPIYGDGRQRREWLHVDDHCDGIAKVLEVGTIGETYNLGSGLERPNLEVIERIIALAGCDPALMRHVPDRPGHDARYALRIDKTRALGWQPGRSFDEGLAATVRWYQEHRDWWEPLKSGNFQSYYQTQYERRLAESTS